MGRQIERIYRIAGIAPVEISGTDKIACTFHLKEIDPAGVGHECEISFTPFEKRSIDFLATIFVQRDVFLWDIPEWEERMQPVSAMRHWESYPRGFVIERTPPPPPKVRNPAYPIRRASEGTAPDAQLELQLRALR